MRTGVVQAAYFLHLADDPARAAIFFRHAAEGKPAETRAALAQMAIDLGRPQIGLRIAKDAAAESMVLPAQYYPLHAIAETDWQVPTEYAMAIARQESEFDAAAGSSAGARGLMQLMPATAKHMAEVAGEPYEPARLTTDPLYNARLGTEYLARMLDYFDGAYVLATAAYNAGPGPGRPVAREERRPPRRRRRRGDLDRVDPLHRDPQLRDAGARGAARLPRAARRRAGAGADRRRHRRRRRGARLDPRLRGDRRAGPAE